MANDGSPQEIRIEFCENYANGDTKQRVMFMIELINRIATGRTTIDDADAVRAMVAALLNSLAFAAWCAKHAHDEETKTRAAALWSSTADALDHGGE